MIEIICFLAVACAAIFGIRSLAATKSKISKAGETTPDDKNNSGSCGSGRCGGCR